MLAFGELLEINMEGRRAIESFAKTRALVPFVASPTFVFDLLRFLDAKTIQRVRFKALREDDRMRYSAD